MYRPLFDARCGGAIREPLTLLCRAICDGGKTNRRVQAEFLWTTTRGWVDYQFWGHGVIAVGHSPLRPHGAFAYDPASYGQESDQPRLPHVPATQLLIQSSRQHVE